MTDDAPSVGRRLGAGLHRLLAALCCGLGLIGCGTALGEPLAATPSPAPKRQFARNRLAYVPPQCFTRVRDEPGAVARNPCYVCHAQAPEPNWQSQPELQLSYAFPELHAGRDAENPWLNLLRPPPFAPQPASARMPSAIDRYVQGDNYRASASGNALAQRLAAEGATWDVDGNGRWDGYVPDAYFAFDAAGFDRAPDGTPSGWRAFAYYPVPGAFMPTNGSFDDAMIRLPLVFAQDASGRWDAGIYAINLAIVEACIKQRPIAIEASDERALGVDLDGDGRLARARRVRCRFGPQARPPLHYAGRAGSEQAQGRTQLVAGLFPEGTEFLHSVRYLAVDTAGRVFPAPRMKELRYARKRLFRSYSQLSDQARREAHEAELNPDRPEQFHGDSEHGLRTSLGWSMTGFIEDAAGELRPQSYEETLYCVGCHGGLSATDDGIFAFSRKLESGPARGFAPMATAAPLRNAPDPLRSDGLREYTTYLQSTGTGDEFGENDETRARFFGVDAAPRPAAFARLRRDVTALMLPSADRARALDAAYLRLVQAQSFAAGRDALLAPARHLWASVPAGQPTGITRALPAPRLVLQTGSQPRN